MRYLPVEHDVIGHGLLEAALAGLPTEDAAQVRDAWCSPGWEHVQCRADKGASFTSGVPGRSTPLAGARVGIVHGEGRRDWALMPGIAWGLGCRCVRMVLSIGASPAAAG
jgi:hypothetical protein